MFGCPSHLARDLAQESGAGAFGSDSDYAHRQEVSSCSAYRGCLLGLWAYLVEDGQFPNYRASTIKLLPGKLSCCVRRLFIESVDLRQMVHESELPTNAAPPTRHPLLLTAYI